MHSAFGATKVDGVFGIWYGKGNGVDRTGDVFRNANMLGTSPLGGVLAIGGDDHAAQSSMFPHQTDGIFQSVMMPVLQPADVREILTLGLAGIALSRSEEHTSELQSLMRHSYAVFCLKKKTKKQ